MIVAIIILAWLLLNTLATMIIICVDGGTPHRPSDWVGIGISCIFSPLVMLFVIQPVYSLIAKRIRRLRK
jgi:uncharacterized membrane protein YhaH (DUF805 family)